VEGNGTEEEPTRGFGVRVAGYVGAPDTRKNFASSFGNEKLWVMMMHMD
jgi:hypothetical protein